jgi:hypothetical protein
VTVPSYPTTKFERAVDSAIARHNEAYLEALGKNPGACPNCLETGGNWCWVCTDPAVRQALEDEGMLDAHRYTNRDRHDRAVELAAELRDPEGE